MKNTKIEPLKLKELNGDIDPFVVLMYKINELCDALNELREVKSECRCNKESLGVREYCPAHNKPDQQGEGECDHVNTKVVKITETKYHIVCECGEVTGVLRRNYD
jgi:hypothetical protein